MKTILLYLILSPLLLFLAFLFKLFSPKQINKIYGYRSVRSMRSEETWKLANDYSSTLFIYIALILNVLQAICFLLLPEQRAFLYSAVAIVFGVILIMPLTEAHLKRNFEP